MANIPKARLFMVNVILSKLFMASVIMPNETDPKTCVQFTQFSLFDILIS